jgi:hypothetical protein
MKILHYIPSIDHSTGGTATYIQLLAKELGKFIILHIASHSSKQPVEIENAEMHYLPIPISLFDISKVKKQWNELLQTIQPNIVHINCCWTPLCALTQKWAQQLGYKAVLSPHGMLEPWIINRHYWTRKLPA